MRCDTAQTRARALARFNSIDDTRVPANATNDDNDNDEEEAESESTGRIACAVACRKAVIAVVPPRPPRGRDRRLRLIRSSLA